MQRAPLNIIKDPMAPDSMYNFNSQNNWFNLASRRKREGPDMDPKRKGIANIR